MPLLFRWLVEHGVEQTRHRKVSRRQRTSQQASPMVREPPGTSLCQISRRVDRAQGSQALAAATTAALRTGVAA